MEPYRARRVERLELWEPPGWRIKVYGLGPKGTLLSDPLVDAAKAAAREVLTRVASGTPHYGLGFLGVHSGVGADVAFVDWWAAENELHHHVFVAEEGRPETLRPRSESELAACVWDLEVISFERDAWVRHILRHARSPRWDDYVTAALESSPPSG